jgi:hypothetical protein
MPTEAEAIDSARAFHARRSLATVQPPTPAAGYRAESLATLFGAPSG